MFIVFIRPVGIVNACTHSFTLMLQEGVHERYKGALRRRPLPQHAAVGRLPRGPRFTLHSTSHSGVHLRSDAKTESVAFFSYSLGKQMYF